MRSTLRILGLLAAGVLAPACSGRYTTAQEPGQSEQGLVQCDAHPQCGVDTPCAGGTCLSISGCGSAICTSAADVCEQACGVGGCEVLESYPAQMPRCPDGTPIKGSQSNTPSQSSGSAGGPSQMKPASDEALGGWGGSLNASGVYGMATPDGRGLGDGHVDCAAYLQCDYAIGCPGESPCLAIDGCQYGVCMLPQVLCNDECAGTCTFVAGQPYRLDCSTGLSGNANYGGANSGGGPRPWVPVVGGAAGSGGLLPSELPELVYEWLHVAFVERQDGLQ